MAKKEKELQTHLKPEQYWEMREAMEEMLHAKTQSELILAKYRIMEKDIEISQLKRLSINLLFSHQAGCTRLNKSSTKRLEKKSKVSLGIPSRIRQLMRLRFKLTIYPEKLNNL